VSEFFRCSLAGVQPQQISPPHQAAIAAFFIHAQRHLAGSCRQKTTARSDLAAALVLNIVLMQVLQQQTSRLERSALQDRLQVLLPQPPSLLLPDQ
jgi:hypothetical protein